MLFRSRAMPSKKLGALNTGGLLDIIDNPYYEMSKEELGAGWEYLSEKREITRQELLEKKHGRPRGFYTNKFNRKAPKAERTYMQDLKIPLSDGTTILNTVNADDEIRYWVLQDHPFVAKSLDEYRKHLKPRATHYIAQQDEDVEERIKMAKLRNKAIARLESDDFIDDNKLLVIKALGWNNRQISLRPRDLYDIINSKLSSSLTGDALDNPIMQFNKTFDLLENKAGREELAARALLQDLLDTRVISNVKETYTWSSRGVVLGYRKEGPDSALEFLLDPTKAPEVDQMTAELKARIV